MRLYWFCQMYTFNMLYFILYLAEILQRAKGAFQIKQGEIIAAINWFSLFILRIFIVLSIIKSCHICGQTVDKG